MDNFLKLAKEADYSYISCNFVNLRTNKTVFEPYKLVDYNGVKIAYVGITTPDAYTKSTPTYFQDENGKYIYGFCEGNQGKDLYNQVQVTVDKAKADGAVFVIAVGHMGVDATSSLWMSTDIIENTAVIDVFLDGHSHSTISSMYHNDKNGNQVI